MSALDTVREILQRYHGESMCAACLAFGCSTSLAQMRENLGQLSADDSFRLGTAACTGCRRLTETITCAGLPKCAYCSRLISDDGLGIVIEGDQFHSSCWKVLTSSERIRISRSLSRQTRELIDQVRTRLAQRRPTDDGARDAARLKRFLATLPNEVPRIFAGQASGGTRCDLCREAVGRGIVEYEVAFETMTVILDRHCFAIWQSEVARN